MAMHPRVRGLYKTYMYLADHHPTMPAEKFREKVRGKFLENKDVAADSEEFKKALGYGRYMLKEFEALIQLHKYRKVKERYAEKDD